MQGGWIKGRKDRVREKEGIHDTSEINENTDIHEFAMYCKRMREKWEN